MGDLRLIRLMRRRKNAIRTPDAALRQLSLYSDRLLFHAHPAQFADQPDDFIRISLLRRNVRGLLLFERHENVFLLPLSFDHGTLRLLQRSQNEGSTSLQL